MGTLVIAFICLFGVFFSQGNSTIHAQFGTLVGNIGVLIGFYYGITGLACGWAYRKVAFKSIVFFFSGVLLPLISGVVLLLVGYEVVKQAGLHNSISILITFALGIPLVILARLTTKGNFFKTKVISYDSIE